MPAGKYARASANEQRTSQLLFRVDYDSDISTTFWPSSEECFGS